MGKAQSHVPSDWMATPWKRGHWGKMCCPRLVDECLLEDVYSGWEISPQTPGHVGQSDQRHPLATTGL